MSGRGLLLSIQRDSHRGPEARASAAKRARSHSCSRRREAGDCFGDIAVVPIGRRASRRGRSLFPRAIVRLACPARPLTTASARAPASVGVIALPRERSRAAAIPAIAYASTTFDLAIDDAPTLAAAGAAWLLDSCKHFDETDDLEAEIDVKWR